MKRNQAATPLDYLARKKQPQDEAKQVNAPESQLRFPEILYKYRSLFGDNFKFTQDIFLRRRLFLSSVWSLNDPGEGTAKSRFGTSSSNEFITCFTTNENNSLMWAHYANAHRGICIGFRTAACAALRCARPIIYQQALPTSDTSFVGRDDAIFLTKSADWKYEQEWRVIQRARSHSRYISLPRNSIALIIVGVRITEDDVQWVQDWIRSFGGQITLLQASFSNTTYDMTTEPYNPARFDPDD